jgi:TonB family protein
VVLLVTIKEDGVSDIRVVRPPGLEEKAIEAVSEWCFQPSMLNGQPVSFPATDRGEFPSSFK